jgi:CRISPR-associated endonuclease Cas1
MQIHLQTFGSRLRVRDGIFELTAPDASGANHHVVESYAPHEIRCIWLQKGTSLSADALLLAIENDVDIQVLDHFGLPKGRFWPNRPTSTLAIWKNQIALAQTPQGLRIARTWIEEKIRSRTQFLRKLKPYRAADKVRLLDEAEQEMTDILDKIARQPLRDFNSSAASIRGLEGTAGRIYLSTLSDLLPKPYQFDGRSAQPASDPFNAFLNYGYAILYNKAERALLLAGLHPYIGFMHAEGYQRKSFLFDFVEQFRVWVDRSVFLLFSQKKGQLCAPTAF